LDGVLIGKFAGAIPLGLYRQAYGLMMAPLDQLQAPIMSVSTPALSRLQDDPERYRRYYERILFAVSALTVPLGCFTIVYAREIVTTVLGPHWADAAPFLMVFGVAASIRPAVATSGMVMFTCGHSGRYLVAACVHAVMLMCAMAVGLAWGALGVAVASVATTIAILPWKLPYSFAGSPVSTGRFLSVTIRPIVAGAVMALVLIWWRTLALSASVPIELVGAVLLAAASYAAVLALTPGSRSHLNAGLADVLMALKRKPL
jgi:PST family polysaccharide transporter